MESPSVEILKNRPDAVLCNVRGRRSIPWPGTEEGTTASFWAAAGRWEWEKSCLPWISCLVLEAAGFDPAWGGQSPCFTGIGTPWAGQSQPQRSEGVFLPETGERGVTDCPGTGELP